LGIASLQRWIFFWVMGKYGGEKFKPGQEWDKLYSPLVDKIAYLYSSQNHVNKLSTVNVENV
jgi:hypothetical protein